MGELIKLLLVYELGFLLGRWNQWQKAKNAEKKNLWRCGEDGCGFSVQSENADTLRYIAIGHASRHKEDPDNILFMPDPNLIKTTVEPVFGKAFVVKGDFDPSWREKLFGRWKT